MAAVQKKEGPLKMVPENQKKQVPLRLSAKLYNAIAAWAEDDFRSVNGQIEYLDIRTVFTTCALNGTYNDSFYNITFFYNAAWCCIFNGSNDDIANTCISSNGAAKYSDAK